MGTQLGYTSSKCFELHLPCLIQSFFAPFQVKRLNHHGQMLESVYSYDTGWPGVSGKVSLTMSSSEIGVIIHFFYSWASIQCLQACHGQSFLFNSQAIPVIMLYIKFSIEAFAVRSAMYDRIGFNLHRVATYCSSPNASIANPEE